MGLPGHRRTSSDKRRRASHFALKPAPTTLNSKTGVVSLSHRAAPGATEYNGHAIHVKGKDKKMEKLLKKSSTAKADKAEAGAAHDHSHEGHSHG
jgi:ribosomal protein L32